MHWIAIFFNRLRFFSLFSCLLRNREPLAQKKVATIQNYKLLTFKNTTNKER
jgi:hypothetical protein